MKPYSSIIPDSPYAKTLQRQVRHVASQIFYCSSRNNYKIEQELLYLKGYLLKKYKILYHSIFWREVGLLLWMKVANCDANMIPVMLPKHRNVARHCPFPLCMMLLVLRIFPRHFDHCHYEHSQVVMQLQ